MFCSLKLLCSLSLAQCPCHTLIFFSHSSSAQSFPILSQPSLLQLWTLLLYCSTHPLLLLSTYMKRSSVLSNGTALLTHLVVTHYETQASKIHWSFFHGSNLPLPEPNQIDMRCSNSLQARSSREQSCHVAVVVTIDTNRADTVFASHWPL